MAWFVVSAVTDVCCAVCMWLLRMCLGTGILGSTGTPQLVDSGSDLGSASG